MKKFYEDEAYIKMCEKAGEIQKIWQSMNIPSDDVTRGNWNYHYEKGYEGSFYYSTDHYSCVDYEYEADGLNGNTDIWLPRQDQLQEMITVKKGDLQLMLMFAFEGKNVLEELHGNGFDIDKLENIESIMLCVIMKKKYNKTWNGEDWL